MIVVRAETAADEHAIRQVHERAFAPRKAEADLVDLLRRHGKAAFSWVAVVDGHVAGHVLFSPIRFVPGQPALRGLGLAPVAVLPEHQNHGIGRKLISHGLDRCSEGGYDLVVVLGDPDYYSRSGFARASNFGLANEYGVDHEFMVIELRAGRLDGANWLVKYEPEFGEVGA